MKRSQNETLWIRNYDIYVQCSVAYRMIEPNSFSFLGATTRAHRLMGPNQSCAALLLNEEHLTNDWEAPRKNRIRTISFKSNSPDNLHMCCTNNPSFSKRNAIFFTFTHSLLLDCCLYLRCAALFNRLLK